MLSLKNVMTHLIAAPRVLLGKCYNDLTYLKRFIIAKPPFRDPDFDYVWILIIQMIPAEFLPPPRLMSAVQEACNASVLPYAALRYLTLRVDPEPPAQPLLDLLPCMRRARLHLLTAASRQLTCSCLVHEQSASHTCPARVSSNKCLSSSTRWRIRPILIPHRVTPCISALVPHGMKEREPTVHPHTE
jgi:hypothetical protein